MSVFRQHKGITLIELLIMLTVVLILTVLSVPLFTSLFQYYRISTAVDNLYSSLQYARTESIKRNANIYVSFVTGDSWCYGISTGSACSCATAGSCNLGSVSASSAGLLTLSTTGLAGTSFYFDSTHSGASSAASITFTLFGQTSLITTSVGRLGNLQVCSTGINGYIAC